MGNSETISDPRSGGRFQKVKKFKTQSSSKHFKNAQSELKLECSMVIRVTLLNRSCESNIPITAKSNSNKSELLTKVN